MNEELNNNIDFIRDPLLKIENICKSFSGVTVLDNINIDFQKGKIHGLVGANGAGKSTLINILDGVYKPDSGSIYLEGRKIEIRNPYIAKMLGLHFIHQQLNLIENFNIIENITLGLPKKISYGLIDWKAMIKDIKTITDRINLNIPLTTKVRNLSIANKWLVAIAKVLYENKNAKIIAMDEPTASLSEIETEILFKVIRDLREQGIAIIYISHRLDEIMEICDDITVMRDGKKILTLPKDQLTKEKLIDAITGFNIEYKKNDEKKIKSKEMILKLENVSDNKLKGINLSLYKGEILGITGLTGAGKTELANLIFGLNRVQIGKIIYKGQAYNPKDNINAIKNGIVMIPEDRHKQGLITNKNIDFNLNITNLHLVRKVGFLPIISLNKKKNVSEYIINQLHIKTKSYKSPILSLSGGNQQKVVIGKWLKTNPVLVILDEPTQGVDVGARSEIYNIINEMSSKGVSFLVMSSDIDEIIKICDRVIVLVNGMVSGELTGTEITKEHILKLCYLSYN